MGPGIIIPGLVCFCCQIPKQKRPPRMEGAFDTGWGLMNHGRYRIRTCDPQRVELVL